MKIILRIAQYVRLFRVMNKVRMDLAAMNKAMMNKLLNNFNQKKIDGIDKRRFVYYSHTWRTSDCNSASSEVDNFGLYTHRILSMASFASVPIVS